MADSIGRIKARWPEAKRAALDELLEDLADRVDELADSKGAATLEVQLHIHKGVLSKARFDSDLEFA